MLYSISVLESSMIFFVSHDCVTVTVTCVTDVTDMYDVMLNSNSKFPIMWKWERKIKKIEFTVFNSDNLFHWTYHSQWIAYLLRCLSNFFMYAQWVGLID